MPPASWTATVVAVDAAGEVPDVGVPPLEPQAASSSSPAATADSAPPDRRASERRLSRVVMVPPGGCGGVRPLPGMTAHGARRLSATEDLSEREGSGGDPVAALADPHVLE